MIPWQRKVTVWATDADLAVLLIHKSFEGQDSLLHTIYQERVGKVYNLFHVTQRMPQSLKIRCSSFMLSQAVAPPHQLLVMVYCYHEREATEELCPICILSYSSTAEKAHIEWL